MITFTWDKTARFKLLNWDKTVHKTYNFVEDFLNLFQRPSDKRVTRQWDKTMYIYIVFSCMHYVYECILYFICISIFRSPAKPTKGRRLCTPIIVYIRVRLGYSLYPGILFGWL